MTSRDRPPGRGDECLVARHQAERCRQRDDDRGRERLRWWHTAIERSLGWAEGADQEGTR